MKIPDKVYIPYEIGPDYISNNYYLGPTPKMENAEYIRKDALLEWLKEKGYEDTDRISVETIIDKINSL